LKPAGQISSVELERLSAFLESGKSLYLEGYDLGQDHYQSDFFNLLGCQFISNGNDAGDISSLKGDTATFVEDLTFEYGHTPSPRCRSDVIAAVEGRQIFLSQDTVAYGIIYDSGKYRVITATFLFGALIDNQGASNKAELMKRYLQFFEGSLSVAEFSVKNANQLEFALDQNYPNPFHLTTTINFSIFDTKNLYTLSVFNLLGQEVKKFTVVNQANENYSANWDGADNNNRLLPSGVYLYQLKVNDQIITRKMNLVR